MKPCKNCGSDRFLSVSAKCSDLCSIQYGTTSNDGYVPEGLNIGGGDYVEIELCVDCGMTLGKFPIPDAKVLTKIKAM